MIQSSPTTAQNTDSLYQLNLRLYINDCEYCHSTLESAQKTIQNDSVIIAKQTQEIGYYSQMNFNLEEINYNLKKKITELESGGLKFWHYAGGAVLVATIGFLIGLQVK